MWARIAEAEYRSYDSVYIGMSEEDLIAEMGIPDKEHSSNSKKFFEYKESYYDKFTKMRFTCNTTYILSNGVVEDITHRGNNCIKFPKLF